MTDTAPPLLADLASPQLWLVAGFILLAWVLVRRQLGMRKRVNRDARAADRELKKMRAYRQPAVPLCDAPVELQRWQTAMFDLQRELKADLETRIAVVQTLVRQADQRIARLETLHASLPASSGIDGNRQQVVRELARRGHTATEIAAETGCPIGDIELTIATMSFHSQG